MNTKLFTVSPSYNLTQLPPIAAYPERQEADGAFTNWEVELPDYKPLRFTHPNVIKAEGVWADSSLEPEKVSLRERVFSRVAYDADGYPLNPHGRTGLAGRGLLGKYGCNVVVDLLATDTKHTYVLAIQRPSGLWALPGGFLENETPEAGVTREGKEETSIELAGHTLKQIITPALFIPDSRITDNAWIETIPFAVKGDDLLDQNPIPGDNIMDTVDAQWMQIPEARQKFLPVHRYILDLYLNGQAI
jgi:ADP-ribose pyrophosphatase YjhB (NUDIX family)